MEKLLRLSSLIETWDVLKFDPPIPDYGAERSLIETWDVLKSKYV